MLSTIHFLNILLPFLYLASFAVYAYDFAKDKVVLANVKRIFLFITLLFHLFYLLIRTLEFNHPPITTVFEIFTLLAFTISCIYFLLELLTDVRGTGLFIILFSLLFQIISSLMIDDLFEVKEVLRSNLLGLHVMSAMFGYSAITISAVYGLLFLFLYSDIKSNKFGVIFNRLPSLEILEKLSFYSVVIGFILLTVSIIIGGIWLPEAFPDFNHFDPKIISTTIVWLIYGIGISTKIIAKWYGKKVIIFSLVGFGVAIFSMIITNIFAQSFHSFY